MLSDRRQIVLRALIEEYIAHAAPVGSRTLVERYNLEFSPATVRNELSSLEEAGYVTQPHTSAGRIPTDYGYRAFVDDLLAHHIDEFDPASVKMLRESATELDGLFHKTSQVLSRLTQCLAFAVPPRQVALSLKQISLIYLTEFRYLLVAVTDDAQVVNRQIRVTKPITEDDLRHTEKLLNRVLAGKSLVSSGVTLPLDPEVLQDPLFSTTMSELLNALKEFDTIHPSALGMRMLLSQPEFSDSSRLLPVLEELEDDTVLLHIFRDALNSDGPIVRIGHENDSDALSDVSLVASKIGEDDNCGFIAIVGPTRMNYSLVLKALKTAKHILNER